MIRLAARGARATWEPCCGHLPELWIDGAPVLHAAPWRENFAVQADAAIPLVDRRLGGTFACAPFGRDDADGGPPHGLSANAPWRTVRAAPGALVAERRLGRGRVRARLALRDGHPALYQHHVLALDASSTFAHHPMFGMAAGGRLSTTPPVAVLTFAGADAPRYHPDQHATGWTLDTPQGPRDWRDYPAEPCEDFVALVHPPGLAFTALAREAEGNTVVTLKRAEQLPLTCLWISNGGRTAPPWNGRRGVLGIEDARCAGADGFAAALGSTWRADVPTAFPPGRHAIPHAILRLPGRHEITGVTLSPEAATFETDTGPLAVPFDGSHLA
ncbi:hypothetical protein [Jannaschia sp. W003]|uniref:hypothetical protein n=1 Tax=Jannaschia sp. W003 TaxID=2867012 RepID=UPI0021A3A4E4|nr:hypothetical protein [Jannaschia sp. W003]UWQ20407.1 hypothetical protein K3554_10415 [Jannaschia sp. W003]